MKKILVVEDNHDVCAWWVGQLHGIFQGAEVLSAASLKGARDLCDAHDFSLVLIDLGLPDGSGIELLAELNRSSPMTYCVVTTVFDDDEHLFNSLRNGAKGYLLKDQSPEQQLQQLRDIADGQPPLSPSIALRILDHFCEEKKDDVESATRLTRREKEILTFIAKGFSRPEIAEQLNLTLNTVCSYTKTIYQKLNVSSQAEAAITASRIGLLGIFCFY